MHTRSILAAAAFLLTACEPLTMSDPGNLVPRTVTEDSSLPAITLNGSRFHAETMGDASKPVLIFLHGGPGGDYRSLLPMAGRFGSYSLVDDYFLVFWDQRGAGLSQRHGKSELSIDTYLADLLALVDRYAPGRAVTLIGQSWGGMYGTAFINRYPERVSRAVFIESGPLKGSTFERIKGDLFDIDFLSEWLNDYAWSAQFLSADDHVRMDYEFTIAEGDAQPRNNVRRGPGAELFWRNGAMANRYVQESGQNARGVFTYDFTTNLRSFMRPVLLIAGGRSEVLGPTLQEEQRALYGNATVKTVADGGHDVHWTHTAAVMTLVHDALRPAQGAAR
jgi:proline iminopeptidase